MTSSTRAGNAEHVCLWPRTRGVINNLVTQFNNYVGNEDPLVDTSRVVSRQSSSYYCHLYDTAPRCGRPIDIITRGPVASSTVICPCTQ